MPDQVIEIPGRRSKSGFIVVVKGVVVTVAHDPFEWLLELCWASLMTDSAWLYNAFSFAVDNDHLRACQLAKRLRKQLKSKTAIANCTKGYGIADNFGPPMVSKSVLEFPDIDYRILKRVEELFRDCHSVDTVRPFSTAKS